MTTLAEFLLTRIAEDQRDVQVDTGPLLGPFAWMQRRVLAECEVKRRLLTWITGELTDDPDAQDFTDALRTLALPYADHPDFRPEWRVEP